MLKIVENPDVEKYNDITKTVINNNGYCPCELMKSSDTKCICKSFKEQNYSGECHCGRYIKIET